MRVQIFSATTKQYGEQTVLYKSYQQFPDIDFQCLPIRFANNNTEPLAKVYNQAIDLFQEYNDWLLLVHDDVSLPGDLYNRITEYAKYDLCGLAGATQFTLQQPALWHIMAGQGNMRGCVAHPASSTPKHVYYTSFGPTNERVIMIDGLFMLINLRTLGDIRFDESNPARFHFYDLDFSLSVAKSGKSVGVIDVPVIHQSPGLKEFTAEWKEGEKWFLDKWSSILKD